MYSQGYSECSQGTLCAPRGYSVYSQGYSECSQGNLSAPRGYSEYSQGYSECSQGTLGTHTGSAWSRGCAVRSRRFWEAVDGPTRPEMIGFVQ